MEKSYWIIPVLVLVLAVVYASAQAFPAQMALGPPQPLGDYVAVLIQSDRPIPPLAYFDGREIRPVHIAYVSTWEDAYWAEGNTVVRIPAWDFKEAVVFLPRSALGARAPQSYRGGVLRIAVGGAVTELLEAPPGVVSTYSYLQPGQEAGAVKAASTWVSPPSARPFGKEVAHGAVPHSVAGPDPVNPDGAFIFNQTRGWMNAGGRYCLNVRRPANDSYSPGVYPTFASVGFNATYIWRTAWYVYTTAAPAGQIVGKAVINVYETDPTLQTVKGLLGTWTADVRNGYVTFTNSIPLSWPDKFIALELCFVPNISGSYVVGANATLGFAKNPIALASGNYYLGPAAAYRGQNVAGYYPTPAKTLLFGPYALADGYYDSVLTLDMIASVPWSSSSCPALTVNVYVGDRAQWPIYSASFAAASYTGASCIYDIRRSINLSPGYIGLWYDEARARDAAVFVKVEFNPPAYAAVYRADISGSRFAENYIDKPYLEWLGSLLRGFYSESLRSCPTGGVAVNGTAQYVDLYVMTVGMGISPADFVHVYLIGASSSKLQRIQLLITPPSAYRGYSIWYKEPRYQEPWLVSVFFVVLYVAKAIADFFGALGYVSYSLDLVLAIRNAAWSDSTAAVTSNGVYITWQSGYAESFRYVGISIDTDVSIQHRVSILEVDSDMLCGWTMLNATVPQMKDVAYISTTTLQGLRHWIYRMRYSYDVPLTSTSG
ncbi:MAG: hypothetical protein ACP5MH_08970 [Thermoproteus sp.]